MPVRLPHFQELRRKEEAPAGSGGLFLDISQLFLDFVYVPSKVQLVRNYHRVKQFLWPPLS